jgi:drug/metabolite transporter (DMT)-like permease
LAANAVKEVPSRDLVYVDRMNINRIAGILLILAGVTCFWLESDDKSTADWKIDALGIVLALLGLWVGKFTFRKDRDGGTRAD